jgi:multiple sugar transport system substrate-binding protein
MEEITFSVFNHGPVALENLRTLLKKFEEQTGIQVRMEIIQTWALGWSRLVENALYRSGPDLSEAGNSWIGDLARMEALQPFAEEEVKEITLDAHLFDNLWNYRVKSEKEDDEIFYSIPWTGDTRAVFYRRDLLIKAGIEEADAFSTTENFEQTVSALRDFGVSPAISLITLRSSLTIHNVASWIWSAGGDFLSPDGISLVFDQPLAMEGCKKYFRLGRSLGPDVRNFDEERSNHSFRSGMAAITLNGYWMLDRNEMVPEVLENLGVAPMPGIPFVGGQDLVIWNHSKHKLASRKLIKYLYSDENARELYPYWGLPVSENAWNNHPFDSGFYPVFKSAIKNGRGFKGQLWGLVEKRLTDEYADIWAEAMKSPDSQLEGIVETHLINLARRLQLSMGA